MRRYHAQTHPADHPRLPSTPPPWYKPAQRMSDHAPMTRSTLAGLGWSYYARYYAWRFS